MSTTASCGISAPKEQIEEILKEHQQVEFDPSPGWDQ